MFYSILDFSKQASTGPSFLLRDSDCVVGLGMGLGLPWPGNNDFKDDDHPASADDNIKDDDGNLTNTYFSAVFRSRGAKTTVGQNPTRIGRGIGKHANRKALVRAGNSEHP